MTQVTPEEHNRLHDYARRLEARLATAETKITQLDAKLTQVNSNAVENSEEIALIKISTREV